MMTGKVHELCREVWTAREQEKLTADSAQLSQQMYVAVAVDIADTTDCKYDPEEDRRVEWLREVIRLRRMQRREIMPFAETCMEDLMGWMLWGLEAWPMDCGKDKAAGN
jgi:hypothetical protein